MPHDVPAPTEPLPPLEEQLKEAVRAEKNLFHAWNNAKENVRKLQEAILVEEARAKEKKEG